jgi:hypothetical protein
MTNATGRKSNVEGRKPEMKDRFQGEGPNVAHLRRGRNIEQL